MFYPIGMKFYTNSFDSFAKKEQFSIFEDVEMLEIKLNVFVEAHHHRILSQKAQNLKLISRIGNCSFLANLSKKLV